MKTLEERTLFRNSDLAYCQESHEIVKYNPQFYDASGVYIKDEWSSISDIGKTFPDGILSLEEYLSIEDRYVNVVECLMEHLNIRYLTIGGLEIKTDDESLRLSDDMIKLRNAIHVGSRLNINKCGLFIRMALRESIWGILVNERRDVQVSFGYDYYMHIHARINREYLKDIVICNGLFMDPRDK